MQRAGRKLQGVEAARGIAAMLVVLYHTTIILAGANTFGAPAFGGAFAFGYTGVDFFFVLSGFIIATVHLPEHPFDWRRYAARRFRRIYPTYWAVLLILGALLAISPTHDRYERHLGAIVENLLLVPTAHDPILGPAWSLSFELAFYIAFGFWLFRRAAGLTVLAAWAVVALAGVPFFASVYNVEFLFGIAVACLVLRGICVRPALVCVIGLAGFFAAGLSMSMQAPGLHLLLALGAAGTLYGLVWLERQRRLAVPRVLIVLGGASYSIYLLHIVALIVLQQIVIRAHLTAAPQAPVFLAVAALAVASGLAFSRVVEMPLIAWCRRLPMRRSHRAARSAGGPA